MDFSSVTPANLSAIDSLIGCSGRVYCANQTFTSNTSIMVGSTNITGVPSTNTYRYDGSQNTFRIGAVNVSGNLAFVASVGSIQKGFSENVTVNYQMLLPTPANTTQRYYFFADPNDECPSGGVGNSINSTLSGYIFDSSSSAVSNATVNVVGTIVNSNSSGFYNISFEVLPGTYNVIVQKTNYRVTVGNVTVTFSNATTYKNFTLYEEITGSLITSNISGLVKDSNGTSISNANISIGNTSTSSSSNGAYSLSTTLPAGTHPIIAFKTNYDNYYAYLVVNSSNSQINHNITLISSNLNTFSSGPYATREDNKHKEYDKAKQSAEEAGQDYWVSTKEIRLQIRKNTFVEQTISLYNFKAETMTVTSSVSPELKDILELEKTSLSIPSESSDDLIVRIYGTEELGTYEGSISLGGSIEQTIPVYIEIVDNRIPIEAMFLDIELSRDTVSPGDSVKYRVTMQNLLVSERYQVSLDRSLVDESGKIIASNEEEIVELKNSLTLTGNIKVPSETPEGNYLMKVRAKFLEYSQDVEVPLKITIPLYLNSFFGIPIWAILATISGISFFMFNLFLYKHYSNKKKRYHIELNYNLLPKEGPRSIKLGKIAEKQLPAYYDLDMLTTHSIIAGATGGGKSIAAQVLIEEALMKNTAVIVFDPTAQWSGMLRKCDDKRMMSFYSRFNLKESDARAFPGNVRQIRNARQLISIEKYMTPGHIQIFTMNKLDPSEIDTFVSGVIAQIFRSDPKENPTLKVILVFDEVHRLLPKFGGRGQGFLQIERACREFRKWGIGVMLVSQVLSDFVGEIKANINTEVQMRVTEESDLNRVKERYGLDYLKSLVRADVGIGMVQNAEYNRGLPYFINFRPILHNTRRLSDEILEKYNSYGEIIEDLEYQIQQLEQEKVDTFDLKMELKLVKDKLMIGNFTIVDIYLDGIRPRITKQWEKLGKKPRAKEIELVSEDDINASLQAAKKERASWEKDNKTPEKEKPTEIVKASNSQINKNPEEIVIQEKDDFNKESKNQEVTKNKK